jgi:hypothetical protein
VRIHEISGLLEIERAGSRYPGVFWMPDQVGMTIPGILRLPAIAWPGENGKRRED